MAVPRKLTKEQAEQNKKKQRILRSAGYNIKVDGSWGPWQEEQYKKVVYARGRKNNTNANVGVMALPIGYGAAQLLEGLGTVSLPSLTLPSATALAASAPIALTLAGPAYGLYERVKGRTPQITQTSPRQREMSVYAPDATRVSKPIVTSSGLDLIGERYVNPIFSRNRYLTSDESENDTIDIETLFAKKGLLPAEAGVENSSVTSPSPDDNDNDDEEKRKRSWFNKITGRNSNSKKPTSSNSKKSSILKRTVKWVTIPPAVSLGLDITGNTIRASKEPEGSVHQWKFPITNLLGTPFRGGYRLWESAAYPSNADSAKISTPQASYQSQQVANPNYEEYIDTVRAVPRNQNYYTKQQLDSMNRAFSIIEE